MAEPADTTDKRNLTKKFIDGLVKGLMRGGDPATVATVTIAELTDFNNTEGICAGASAGLGASGGGSLCLVRVKKPGGRHQFALTSSWNWDTADFEFGVSADLSGIKSNADDPSQLAGTGWNNSVSGHAGIGLTGTVGKAIGTKNSQGDDVYTLLAGTGWGVGAGIGTGFDHTKVLWESQ